MKKILLVNPNNIYDTEFGPPRMGLGLAYIAAVIKKHTDAQVKILDKFANHRLNNFNLEATEQQFGDTIESFRPDIIGFTSYTETIADVLKDAYKAKTKLPGSVTIIGGAHATALPEETLAKYNFLDIAVAGEGEYTILDIINGIPLDKIPGIFYRDHSRIHQTAPRPPQIEIDKIPFPARDMLNMEYYSSVSNKVHSRGSLRYATILSSRGCIAGCSFCLQVKVHRRYCCHSINYVISEIESILSNYPQVNALEFIDNLFLCDTEQTENLCKELIKTGINKRLKWKAQTRPDKVKKDTLLLMKEAGCFMLGFGFESGSQRILDRMNKRVTVEQCAESARLTKETGIQLEAYFIYGYPQEQKEDFLATLELIQKINPDFVGYGKFSPVPGSLDYERLIKQDKIAYRYNDSGIDWQKINPYRKNVLSNYTSLNNDEFKKLENNALYEVIKPINIRHHISEIKTKDILKPGYLLKLAKKSFILFKNPRYFISRAKDFAGILLRKKTKS